MLLICLNSSLFWPLLTTQNNTKDSSKYSCSALIPESFSSALWHSDWPIWNYRLSVAQVSFLLISWYLLLFALLRTSFCSEMEENWPLPPGLSKNSRNLPEIFIAKLEKQLYWPIFLYYTFSAVENLTEYVSDILQSSEPWTIFSLSGYYGGSKVLKKR